MLWNGARLLCCVEMSAVVLLCRTTLEIVMFYAKRFLSVTGRLYVDAARASYHRGHYKWPKNGYLCHDGRRCKNQSEPDKLMIECCQKWANNKYVPMWVCPCVKSSNISNMHWRECKLLQHRFNLRQCTYTWHYMHVVIFGYLYVKCLRGWRWQYLLGGAIVGKAEL